MNQARRGEESSARRLSSRAALLGTSSTVHQRTHYPTADMEKRCTECPEPRLAQSLCTFCNKWLCYQCTDMHQHQKATPQCSDLHQHQKPTTQCVDLHQRDQMAPSSLPPPEPGTGLCGRPLLMCHSHRQEPLELFCESCDLMCCSSCHLSAHKNHRLVHIGKALQDQQWQFESLMAQVEERRSAVESTAKQIEDRLHGVKVTQRKAENQIKMAKMIMMNELNKRANLLIEQLEKISEDFQRRLEDQLQGAIEMCSQLDHVQNFISWATAHHLKNPLLLSRELISLQMQRLLEPPLHSDAWLPVKIKFNWDASYWTKQISTLGQLTAEGGNRPYSEGVAFPSILRPQPITCLSLPSVCHGGREQSCAFQACCQSQMCCLHCIPPQPAVQLDKTQREPNSYSARCAQSTISSPSLALHQSQLLRCWGPDSPPGPPAVVPSSMQCPQQQEHLAAADPGLLSSSSNSRGLGLQTHATDLYQPQIQPLPETHAQPATDGAREGQGQQASREREQTPGQPAVDREVLTEQIQEGCREKTHVQTGVDREVLTDGIQQELQQQQQQLLSPLVAKLTVEQQEEEQQEARTTHPSRDCRDGRRSTSLEMSVTTHGFSVDAQSSRPSTLCGRKSRSQSIPPELAGPSTDRPPGATHSLATAAVERGRMADQGFMDLRRRRLSSDGVIRSVASLERSLATPPSRGQPNLRLSPLTIYKTEPDYVYAYDETGHDVKGKCRIPRKTPDNSDREVQKEPGSSSSKVPVVCLERLKILVSRIPPQGRRQSDPLPDTATERTGPVPQRGRKDKMTEGISKEAKVATVSPSLDKQYSERHTINQSLPPPVINDWPEHGRHSPHKELTLQVPATDLVSPPPFSAPDLDSDSDPRSISETVSDPELDSDPQPESDPQQESDPPAESASEADLESVADEESPDEAGTESEPNVESEPRVESEGSEESENGLESENVEDLDADAESEADMESDLQPDPGSDPRFASETRPGLDSDLESDNAQPPESPESQGSAESGPDLESEPDSVPDPAFISPDPGVESCPAQRALPADPGPQMHCEGAEQALPGAETMEMESEDFCAVCLIGGDLLCCDHCPKVFHLSCHVPALLSFPTGDWVCTFCRDIQQPEVEYDCENQRLATECSGKPLPHGLSACDQRKCERLTLLICSNMLSAPFHEPVSPLARHYYQIIKRPMDLSVIRAKLSKRSTHHYYSPEEFVADVSLMFRNCAKFNYPDSEVAQAGRSLEMFFSSRLREVFPDRAFPAAEDDSDSDEYDEVYRAAEGGFPWPEKREQCHRKRKRRHSLSWRKHNF
ncbi:tripartite motif-containing protein 66-like [Oncorhynchus masou masou]|uniref:tripartite motif-containing protein 66-like n=1 Tax=Oncorhynchus masou masou TaxID=90313 RepID=UPI00318429E5